MPPGDDCDYAVTCMVADLNYSFLNKKVRIVGKILSYDPVTYLLLLVHQTCGVLVDMSLCLDPSISLHYLRENKGTLMVIGTLERTTVALPLEVPLLAQFVDAPSLDDHLVLRGLLARSVNDLNLDRWIVSLQAKEATRHTQVG